MKRDFIPENLYQEIISRLPIATVDLVVKMKESFLLVKRLEGPAKNQWWFPGGRVLFNENLEGAVKRKLKGELNIRNYKKIKFLGVNELHFKKGIFNRPVHTITIVFLVELNKKDCLNIRADQTILKFNWFNNIPPNSHSHIKKFLKLVI